MLAAILAYVAAFAAPQGPVVWVVIAEIFATRIRGRAVSIATVCLWASCYLVSQTFPVLSAATGSTVTFWIYAVSCVVAVLFIWRLVPETKGQSLGKIETLLNRSRPRPAGTLCRQVFGLRNMKMVSFHLTLVRPGPTLLARRLAAPASRDVTFDIRRR